MHFLLACHVSYGRIFAVRGRVLPFRCVSSLGFEDLPPAPLPFRYQTTSSTMTIFCQILRFSPFVRVSISLTAATTTVSSRLCAYEAEFFQAVTTYRCSSQGIESADTASEFAVAMTLWTLLWHSEAGWDLWLTGAY